MLNKQIISDAQLNLFCDYVFKNFGIYIEDQKRKIFEIKLVSLMQSENITDASVYYHMIVAPAITQSQKNIKNAFIDTVTVHKTNFFRENRHFEYLKENINRIIEKSGNLKTRGELRVWSAACSTGEEPYSLSMLLKEILPYPMTFKILGTDISPKSIQTAMQGTMYKFTPEDHIPASFISKYFTRMRDGTYSINEDVKKHVTFRLFNLMEPFPFKTGFDIIFCRNVMIYFNRDVQETLVNKFYNNLEEGGLLFIGHSESLVQLKQAFKYVEPTVYIK